MNYKTIELRYGRNIISTAQEPKDLQDKLKGYETFGEALNQARLTDAERLELFLLGLKIILFKKLPEEEQRKILKD